MTDETRQLMLAVINNNKDLCFVMFYLYGKYNKDMDRILRWLIARGIMGNELLKMIQIEHDGKIDEAINKIYQLSQLRLINN